MATISANNELSAFFTFADAEMGKGNKRAVARFGADGGGPGHAVSVVAASGFGHEFVGNVFRSARTEDINDMVRRRFLSAVLKAMGTSDVKDLPDVVRDALRMDDFGKGLPLTARRIAAVKAAMLELKPWTTLGECAKGICGLIRGARNGQFGERTMKNKAGMGEAEFQRVRTGCLGLFRQFSDRYVKNNRNRRQLAVLATGLAEFGQTGVCASLRKRGAWNVQTSLEKYKEAGSAWQDVRNGKIDALPFKLFFKLLSFCRELVAGDKALLPEVRKFLGEVLREICAGDENLLAKCWPGEKDPGADPDAELLESGVSQAKENAKPAAAGKVPQRQNAAPSEEDVIDEFVLAAEDTTKLQFPIGHLKDEFLKYFKAKDGGGEIPNDVQKELDAWSRECEYASNLGFCLDALEKRIKDPANDLANQACVQDLLRILRAAAERAG